jgi:glycosyltransferase involved in cell wall biosynthesis
MKYSIIIPYRNREEHLSILLPVLSEKFQNKNYEIIVAEQNDNEKFRLSSLYNIAFKYTSGC